MASKLAHGVEKVVDGVEHVVDSIFGTHLSDGPLQHALREQFAPKGCAVACQGDKGYTAAAYQYATSSLAADHASIPPTMAPLAVITPKGPTANADVYVAKAIEWAAAHGYAVVVRTGGHSYGGSSSGDGRCIQIDLSEGYAEHSWDNATGIFTTGVSLSLGEFNKALGQCDTGTALPKGCFLPTGQCSWVHLGGHMQTGGWGQLTRAHGMLADHVRSIDVWTCGADKKAAKVTTKPGDELFKAMMGVGFGGSWGIAVTVTFEPLRASNHPYSRAGRLSIPYQKGLELQTLEKLLAVIHEWTDVPADYDLSITLTAMEDAYTRQLLHPSSTSFDAAVSTPGLRNFFRRLYTAGAQVLLIYFQYSNLDAKPDTYDPQYWERVMKALRPMQARLLQNSELYEVFGFGQKMHKNASPDSILPMPDCVALWTYGGKREINYPYIKCCQATDKLADPAVAIPAVAKVIDDAAQPGFPHPWIADPKFKDGVHKLIADVLAGNHKLVADATKLLMQTLIALSKTNPETKMAVLTQFQNFGGPKTALYRNMNPTCNGTGISWRTSTFTGDVGFFYNPAQAGAEDEAKKFHQQAVAAMTSSAYSLTQHRLVAFPHDVTSMSEEHAFYVEPALYDFAVAFKSKIDPCNLFSANPYCFGYVAPPATRVLPAEGDAAAPAEHLKLPERADFELTQAEDEDALRRLHARVPHVA